MALKGRARRSSSSAERPQPGSWARAVFAFFCARVSFTTGFGKSRIEVAGLASLADRPAEWFHIGWLFQVGPLFFLAFDLIFMPGNCFPRFLSLTAQLGEPLSQRADDQRLIDPKTQCLGLIQIDRASQVAKDPPRLMLGVLLITLQANTVLARLFHRTQSFLKRFDLGRRIQQRPGRVELG